MEQLRTGLAKLQQSSVQLLEAVESLEVKEETDRSQLLLEIAKLEFNMSRAAEEQREELNHYHDNVRTEVLTVSRVNGLADQVHDIRKDAQEKAAKQTDANYRLETITRQFFAFQKRVKSVLGIDTNDGLDTSLSEESEDIIERPIDNLEPQLNRSWRPHGSRLKRHHKHHQRTVQTPLKGG